MEAAEAERDAAMRQAKEAQKRIAELQRHAREREAALQGLLDAAEEKALDLALDGAWTAAAESMRAERTRRARQMPEQFICPITQAPPRPHLL